MTIDNYFVWRGETEKEFQALSEVLQLKSLLQKHVEALGFDAFAFLVQHPVPFTRPRIFLFSTYPQSWVKRYESENYYAVDPVLMLCQQPGRGVEWTRDLFTGAGNLWAEASQTQHRRVELEVQLHFLAEQSLRVLDRLNDGSMVVLSNDFSQRELEILKWTAEGKTSAEISLILAISEHTVNFHQKNMQKRFNVSNKTQIACYAAAIGLI